ncbi:dihydrofolate reductase family protein [Spiractinospora alimapuensis]|uniref:dihydrofolate reductase family protein n=1 Tax=Spiractinospora alimapuensis TaxID=2820884 RepID=UPI001F362FF6|nr:dihydrofolate reductase family protein [Spiractinospora alimapuensis]QVQ50118.1 dihydrofolate reductase family protein [Spiractinospora alimapuensis]
MGRLIVYEFCSIDGRFDGPAGEEMDWVQRNFSLEIEQDLAKQYTRIGAFLMGRSTFDALASYWPTPAAAHEHLVDAMNTIPKLVVSHRPDVDAWPGSHHLGPDPLSALREELAARGDIMLIGSHDVARQLADADLVDEYRLLVIPEIVGGGRVLFPDSGPPSRWTTTRSERFDTGAVALHLSRPPRE